MIKSQFKNVEIEIRNREVNRKFLIRDRKKFLIFRRALMNNTINLNELIQNEVNRISLKYGKDFLDCEDLIKITGLGRDNVRTLMRSKNFPTTKVGKRQVVSVLNFVTWLTINNNKSEVQNG